MQKLWLTSIFAVLLISCGSAATTTPGPTSTATFIPTPTAVLVQIGVWDTSPSPYWLDGTIITMYREGVDGKIMLESRFFGGGVSVQELSQRLGTGTTYDVVDNPLIYYVLQDRVLGVYDEDGLIWEAKKR
jgi:hypothetical protein